VGDFDAWDGLCHPLRRRGHVWELFVPGVGPGELYKFAIWDRAGQMRMKTDPYGTYFEAPPTNAAIVHDTTRATWIHC